jgi:hypothetical protein
VQTQRRAWLDCSAVAIFSSACFARICSGSHRSVSEGLAVVVLACVLADAFAPSVAPSYVGMAENAAETAMSALTKST